MREVLRCKNPFNGIERVLTLDSDVREARRIHSMELKVFEYLEYTGDAEEKESIQWN